jgi:hypothetical protein
MAQLATTEERSNDSSPISLSTILIFQVRRHSVIPAEHDGPTTSVIVADAANPFHANLAERLSIESPTLTRYLRVQRNTET